MFKFLGALLIFTSSTIIGFKSSLIQLKRYKNLMKISSALTTMKNEIRYSQDYIDDILIKVAKINNFSKIFQSAATSDNSIPISTRWKNAVLADAKSLNLAKEDCETLIILGQELGMTDREGQLKIIENSLSMLNTLQQKAKEDYENKSKLKKGLGMALGLFAVILLF